jgi:hypothetical protein
MPSISIVGKNVLAVLIGYLAYYGLHSGALRILQ